MINEVEAVLFLSPRPMTPSEIAELLNTSEEDVLRAIEELKRRYEGTALTVEEFLGAYRLGIREEYVSLAKKLGLLPEFTRGELRAIALIMKKGEVKLSELRKRFSHVNELLEKLRRYGFVVTRKKGRTVFVRKTKVMDSYFRLIEGT